MKQRIDSTTEAVRIIGQAEKSITAPSNVPLDKCDHGFFASILEEIPRSEWTAHQIEIAALLARTMADLETEQRELRVEGSVSMTTTGLQKNPRTALVQMHSRLILSFRRSLSLHARARGGEARDIGKRRNAAKVIEDGLLARPQ